MKKSYIRKNIVFGIIILFIGVSVTPSLSGTLKEEKQIIQTGSRNILYVGGKGPVNYSNIQDAIDDSSDGDIIFVYDDSSPYYENLIVDKSINLCGEDKDTTVIDGNTGGDAIYVSADWVNISGFTIRNVTSDWFWDYGIEISSNNCTIEDNNIISNSNEGLHFIYSNNNNILNNYFSQNHYSIRLRDSNHNTISGNTITYDYAGIVVTGGCDFNIISNNILDNVEEISIYFGSNCNNNIIINNSLSDSKYGIQTYPSSYNNFSSNTINNCDIGLDLRGSIRSIVYGNWIMNCGSCGIYSSYSNLDVVSSNYISNSGHGIYLIAQSNNYSIFDNIITSNSGHGIYLEDSMGYTSFDTISDNTINLNSGHGIYFKDSSGYTISDNTINSNGGYGIYLEDSTGFTLFDTISDNTVTSNGGHGIYFKDSSGYTISVNTINSNSVHGIYIENSTGYALFDTISDNTVKSNGGHGIYFKNSSSYNISYNSINSNIGHGIYINSPCNNNTIIYNNVSSNNGYGIRLENDSISSSNNIMYHNNFINNIYGGYDDCKNNKWNISYYYSGNYWSNYNGPDDYRGPNQTTPGSDGIGDMPYYLDGGSNKDKYPLMYIWGEQRPVANFTYSIECGGYLFNGLSSYDRDGVVLFYNWEFGDGSTSQEVIATHGYNESGEYNVTLTVTDDYGYEGFYTRSIEAEKNYSPGVPSIDGPTKGKTGKKHLYNFTTKDPELADISYYVEWGDGKVTLWCGFLPSGETYRTNHDWAKGTYTIRAKAKDVYGAESNWGTLEVSMPKNKPFIFNFPVLNWLFERFPNLFPVLRYITGV